MAGKLRNEPDTNQPIDEQILARALAGDVEAFGDLYERHLDDIYNYVYYRVDHREEAEDLSEAVFLRAWRALDENPPREVPFLLWLYRIAHNAVVDHYRTRKDHLGLEAAANVPDPKAGPESLVTSWEDITELRRAIRRLSEDHQEVLVCRFIAGLSHAETAVVMTRSNEAVRALQYRALVALRKLLGNKVGKYG
jgi:RNA polymerase sigma-70 factor (ECF subfamily)